MIPSVNGLQHCGIGSFGTLRQKYSRALAVTIYNVMVF